MGPVSKWLFQDDRARTPRLFIASSSESLSAANALKRHLELLGISSVIWDRAFQASRTNIENLEALTAQVSGAIFLMGPDDVQVFRKRRLHSVRDNVLLELGLFVGKLGRPHCTIVRPTLTDWRWPTDLDGVASLKISVDAFRPNGALLSRARRPVRAQRGAAQKHRIRQEYRRLARDLRDHFLGVETQRWGQVRTNVGYLLRAVRDTYHDRMHALGRNTRRLPEFRLNLMTPTADRSLCIACVDYESHFHEKEFEKKWLEGEGKCGHAWKHGIQSIFGAGLDIADAGLTPMRKRDTPATAKNRKSVLSTPVFWRDTPVGVLNFDSADPAKVTCVHHDTIRECFLMAAARVGALLHGIR
jgi:hypothetical protein